MKQNYDEYIMEKIREASGMECDDTSRDYELERLSPEEVFEMILEYEGIIGYANRILGWIQDVFKVKLNPYGGGQSRQDFVQGMGNIFRAQDYMDDVVAMRMDDSDIVTITFYGGGTHTVNCAMDSKRAILQDITNRGF